MYYRYSSIEREGAGVCHEGGMHQCQTDELLDKWFPEYTSYIEVID